MRRALFLLALAALGLLVPLTAGAAKRPATKQTYVVLSERGASAESVRAAIGRAGGKVVRQNRKVGVATVRSANARFVTDVARSRFIAGAARNRPLGYAPAARAQAQDRFAIERMSRLRTQAAGEGRVHGGGPTPLPEPFSDLQWDMQKINATPEKSYKRQRGN